MCARSVILDYGMMHAPTNADALWWELFNRMLADAERFDQQTNQPDCVDPHKEAWLQRARPS